MCWLACSTAPALIEEAPLNSLEFHCRQLLWLSSGQTQVVKYSVVTRAEGCSTLPEEPEINCSWGALRSESTRPCARILAQIKANPTVQLPGHHGLCWGQEKPSARSTRGASAFGLRPEREAVRSNRLSPENGRVPRPRLRLGEFLLPRGELFG